MPPSFAAQLDDWLRLIRPDPADAVLRARFEQWLNAHQNDLASHVAPEALTFGIAPALRSRRLQFLKHLLLNGYAPPRVESYAPARWTETVNVGVITAYFYPHALSLLEAARQRNDLAVFVAYPAGNGHEQWVRVAQCDGRMRVTLQAALMLDGDDLVWRRFSQPVEMHYLLPIDNYYRDKFRLVNEYARSGVPMPGSTLIRDVCESKQMLQAIAGNIPGLHLAREVCLTRQQGEGARIQALDRWCAAYHLRHLVTKPIDGFGGIDVEFWRYPHDREALLSHLREALTAREAMLVQQRIFPVPTHSGREWNIRQYVLRGPDHTILAPWKRVRIGSGIINTTQGAQGVSVEQLLVDLVLTDHARDAFTATMQATDAIAADVLRALERYLKREHAARKQAYKGSGSNLEPDLLALDFMIAENSEQPDRFNIYLNEINDFASGGMRDYEIIAHRQAFPQAERISADQPFSLAPAMLNTAFWRGSLYKQAVT